MLGNSLKTKPLTKEHIIQSGGKHEIGKVYRIDCFKVVLFEEGFLFILGTSMFAQRIKGKTIAEFDKIMSYIEQDKPTI